MEPLTTPYSYQIRGVRMMQQFLRRMREQQELSDLGARILLADAMGLGKSLQALMFALRNPEARPIVIVCPANLKWNWQNEIIRHTNLRPEILERMHPPRGGFSIPPQVLIINYDILRPAGGGRNSWVRYLKTLKPQLLIGDEIHLCINRRAKRTRAMRSLARSIPHFLALSGTPLTNTPAELWTILNMLRMDLFPSFTEFAWEYTHPKKERWGWVYPGSKNLDKLHAMLSETMMIRRRKEDVLTSLPKKTRVVIPLDLTKRKEYDRAVGDFVGWLTETGWSAGKVRRAMRAEQITKLGYLKRLVAKLKLQHVIEWVDDFLVQSDEKLIIFAIHKKIIARLRKRYQNCCVVVDGSTPKRERQRMVEKFQHNPAIRVFIGNIRAAGVGLNLTAASAVAFAELDWVPASHIQGEDRAHRIGTKKNVTCYYLIAHNTLEERLLKIIQAKQKHLVAILDGKRKGDDLDVYNILTRTLLKAAA